MTLRNLMTGYTAYTDAQELTTTRGSHQNGAVTTIAHPTTTVVLLCHDPATSGTVPISVRRVD
ncbi:LxmA leader domain family RiPP [Actinophytocola xinjiangensis]|uniref:LxmA leader domain family RiPP n=1 Tax=Actinophytocola xinjiangensis TaxID=485602 RepID=UPI0012B81E1C|nr:LxmA leader domain family RiPP [Actinophytocola xinjiangensis]